jgi:hypothetical protein
MRTAAAAAHRTEPPPLRSAVLQLHEVAESSDAGRMRMSVSSSRPNTALSLGRARVSSSHSRSRTRPGTAMTTAMPRRPGTAGPTATLAARATMQAVRGPFGIQAPMRALSKTLSKTPIENAVETRY